jgi:nucleoside-diphosphate-sugar epimerase
MRSALAKVFVTGASGFIGTRLCARLDRRGFSVTPATRELSSSGSIAGYIETGNLEDCNRLEEVVAGHDVIVHLAGRAHVLTASDRDSYVSFRRSNVDATVRLAKAALSTGVRRFVFVSSIGVHGDSVEPVTEIDAPAPATPYAESKLHAERALADVTQGASMQTVVLRPTLVYGPHCPGNMARLARLVARGIPLPLASLSAKRSLIGVENLASLIESVLLHPAAANEVFLAADGEDISVPELVRHLAAGLEVSARLFGVPFQPLSLAALLVGQGQSFNKLTAPVRADVTKARTLLGWSPDVPVAVGLRETGRSFARRRVG